MFDWVEDLVRELLWSLTSAILNLMDIVYQTIFSLSNLDISSFKEIWAAFSGICLFIGFFVFYRIASRSFKKLFDFEEKEQFNPLEILVRTGLVSVIIISFPMIFTGINTVGTLFQRNVASIMGVQSDILPSTVIVSSYASDGLENFIHYTVEQIDITAKTAEGRYKFFDGFQPLFVVSFLGIGSSIILIAIGLSIGKRLFELAMLILVSPLPLSSMVFKEGDLSGTWLKAVASIYFCNFMSIAGMILAIHLSVSKGVQEQGTWIQLIVLIGALLSVLSGVPQLAKFIGADAGSSDTLQQIAQIRMAGAGAFKGVGSMFEKASRSVMGAGGAVGATAVYGAGRAFGGQSVKAMGGIEKIKAGVERMSKSGTVFGKMHDTSNRSKTTAAVTSLGRHMYSAAAQRVGRSKTFNRAATFNKNRQNNRFVGDSNEK